MHALGDLLSAFAQCLQADVAPAARRDVGLHGVLRAAFPIEVGSGVLLYESYAFEAPRWPVEVCLLRATSFLAPLKLTVQLVDRATGDVKEQEIYFGHVPLMTSEGTFVIDGEERVLDDASESLTRALATGIDDLATRLRAFDGSIEGYMPHDLVDARPLAMALHKLFERTKRVRALNPIVQLDHVLGRASTEPYASARVLVDPQTSTIETGDEIDVARATGLVRLAGVTGELVVLETGAVVILPSDGAAAFVIEPRRWSRRGRRAVDRLVRSSGAVVASDVVFECDGAKDGKLALGRHARVRFDASAKKAVVSETFANAMRATEVFVLEANVKDTRYGKQTRTSVAPLGVSVETGDVLVGIASPDLTQLDPSLVVKRGIGGRVVRVDMRSRMSTDRSSRTWEEIKRVAAERSDPRFRELAENHESQNWRRDELPPGVIETVRVTIEREIPLGPRSRIADRHGGLHAIARVDGGLDVDAILPGAPSVAAQREVDAGGLYLLHLAKKAPK